MIWRSSKMPHAINWSLPTCLNIIYVRISISFSHKQFFNLLQGLVVSSRLESLQHFKKPWAHDHEPVKELIDAVKVWNLRLSIEAWCDFNRWWQKIHSLSHFILHLLGNKANCSNRNFRSWKNIYEGSRGDYGFSQSGRSPPLSHMHMHTQMKYACIDTAI